MNPDTYNNDRDAQQSQQWHECYGNSQPLSVSCLTPRSTVQLLQSFYAREYLLPLSCLSLRVLELQV